MIRIGHGFDVHRFDEHGFDEHGFEENRPGAAEIKLGGVSIASDKPLLAHSDGDVLIHALCDALLGAAGLGDIGEHFPDTDAAYLNADSRLLLRKVVAELTRLGWLVGNADITLIAQTPKVSPYKKQMAERLASDMGCDSAQINIKATTTEGLGYTGRKEGIACHAVVLLTQG